MGGWAVGTTVVRALLTEVYEAMYDLHLSM